MLVKISEMNSGLKYQYIQAKNKKSKYNEEQYLPELNIDFVESLKKENEALERLNCLFQDLRNSINAKTV